MGNLHHSQKRNLPLADVNRIYNLPSEQLVLFSMICESQRYLETRIEYYADDLPCTETFEISYQTGQRIILRVKDEGLVKDVWFVSYQSEDTIEMHTAQWFVKQTVFPTLKWEEKGHWLVSHTSAVGIALKCKGLMCTTPAKTVWSIHSSSTDTIVLHSCEWYRLAKEAQRPVIGAHRGVPPSSPRLT